MRPPRDSVLNVLSVLAVIGALQLASLVYFRIEWPGWQRVIHLLGPYVLIALLASCIFITRRHEY